MDRGGWRSLSGDVYIVGKCGEKSLASFRTCVEIVR